MPVTGDDVLRIAREVGFDVPASELAAYTELLQKADAAFETVAALDDYQPTPDLKAAPRNNVHRPDPQDSPLNAWAWRCNCEHASPSTTLLKVKTVCFKDNIAMAGVPCLVGTDSFSGWTPSMDATVVTRVLENGGTVAGKAVCENLSRGAVSCTAATGPVHNPRARGYNAGGSSSGTVALVGSGAIDMGLGCDQGGSIRIPAAMCGLYGFKATTGLCAVHGHCQQRRLCRLCWSDHDDMHRLCYSPTSHLRRGQVGRPARTGHSLSWRCACLQRSLDIPVRFRPASVWPAHRRFSRRH